MIKTEIKGNGWRLEIKNIENAMHLYKVYRHWQRQSLLAL